MTATEGRELQALAYTADNDIDTELSLHADRRAAARAGSELARRVWREKFDSRPFPESAADDEHMRYLDDMDALRTHVAVRLEMEPIWASAATLRALRTARPDDAPLPGYQPDDGIDYWRAQTGNKFHIYRWGTPPRSWCGVVLIDQVRLRVGDERCSRCVSGREKGETDRLAD